MKVVCEVLGKISASLARASAVIVVLLCIGLAVSLLTSVFSGMSSGRHYHGLKKYP